MKNHLLRFADEAEAKTALSAWCPDGEWRGDVVIPGQRVILARATHDADGNEIAPEAVLSGWFVTITAPHKLPDLTTLHACRLVGDFKTGAVVWTAPDINLHALATAIVEPMPMGSGYRFGP